MQPEGLLSADVVVAGGGIAGTVAAWTLRQTGLSVILVDENSVAATTFKAERISCTTAAILGQLGLRDRLERIALPLRSTATIKNGAVVAVSPNTDYSVPLWKLVAELRATMNGTDGLELLADHVENATTSADRQSVQLRSGRVLECRLLVVATGAANGLLNRLGIERQIISANHSTTFGFDIVPALNFALPADSVSVRLCRDGADYMNIFPTPDGKHRANLFTYWPAGGEQVRRFVKGDSNAIVHRLAPRVARCTGDWQVTGPIECGSVSVMKSAGYQQPGLVLLGDAYGRICPCLGMGVNKTLADVESLRKYAPSWLRSGTPLNWETIAQYYHDAARVEFETLLYKNSLFIRNRLLSWQPIWWLRRWYYRDVPETFKRFVRGLLRGNRRLPGAAGVERC